LASGAQVVHQSLWRFCEKTKLQKIEKTRFVREAELCALAGEAEGDEAEVTSGGGRKRREEVSKTNSGRA